MRELLQLVVLLELLKKVRLINGTYSYDLLVDGGFEGEIIVFVVALR